VIRKHGEEDKLQNGNGKTNLAGVLPTVISTMVVVLTMFAGFWQLADPRASLSDLKATFANYLTIREHNQFTSDLDHRLEVLTKEMDNVHLEQQTRAGSIEHIHSLEKALDELKKSHDELAKEINSSVTISDRMKELQTEINNLREHQITKESK
jgi:hypothetical protein